jgi:hypothetical protein
MNADYTDRAVITIATPADLASLAQDMRERYANTGQIEEQKISLSPEYTGLDHETIYTLTLRPAPGQAMQLLSISLGRHWPTAHRAEIARAFNIPVETRPNFQIVKGWQVTKWTWRPTVTVEQFDFLPAIGPVIPNNYRD